MTGKDIRRNSLKTATNAQVLWYWSQIALTYTPWWSHYPSFCITVDIHSDTPVNDSSSNSTCGCYCIIFSKNLIFDINQLSHESLWEWGCGKKTVNGSGGKCRHLENALLLIHWICVTVAMSVLQTRCFPVLGNENQVGGYQRTLLFG